MRRTISSLVAVLVAGAAGCASAGERDDDRVRSGASTMDRIAAESCLQSQLRDRGYSILDEVERDGSFRALKPRREILGVPTTDDHDRIDARVTTPPGTQTSMIELTLGTYDGNERESTSAEVRRDAGAVLQACR